MPVERGRRRRLARASLSLSLLVCALLLCVGVAGAAVPVANGKIAFERAAVGGWETYTIGPDGTGETRLASSSEDAVAWSPDGTKVAFESNRDGNLEIYVMNADGSGPKRLTTHPFGDGSPAWSPDGTKLAFISAGRTPPTNDDPDPEHVYVMNADGSDQRQLSSIGPAVAPTWSPGGSSLAFRDRRRGGTRTVGSWSW